MAPVPSPRDVVRAALTTTRHVDAPSLPLEILRRETPSASSGSHTAALTRLLRRLATDVSAVPQGYGLTPSGPDAGTVVGIVLGSVAGFILVLWLIYTCVNLGNPRNTVVETASVGGTASVVTRKSRKHRRRSHHSHSRSPRRETVEVRRTERIVPVPGPERIIVEERSRSRGPPPPPMPPPPRMVVDDDDDEVVVIEENTPPRRRESRHKRRSSERRSSGYREVDPYRYAGGDEPIRSVSRRRSDSRRR
ncbi:uncharacterized protein JN550_002201 [Neoarthrinium moseri]|uniref:uncharacterized protein n=1 Tax=Neoarthrinium moseri TaxID=1658444 RepID=UPI001FDCC6D5|nr:uncharacterized protein JN550_002201 [Neoarthrinium moseri]KAI1874772.1 hypothetical protein JN550_002201 [Neoarthrinium moseri]